IPFAAEARIPADAPRPVPPRKVDDSTGPRPVRGIVGPSLSPDGDQVIFCALGDLWHMVIGGAARRLTHDAYLVADPAWSPDGTRVVYTSDRGGSPDLWVHDVRDGRDAQVTDLPYPAVAAAWSRDGTRIAFQNHEGALHVLTLASGAVTKVSEELFAPGRPTWSPDGNMLALAAGKPYSKRFREGTNQILTIDLRTGGSAYHPVAPHRSISTRGYDGPVWSPDGTMMAFVMSSLLHVIPVDATGRATGEPRQINDEVTDAPSWSGDSSTLLYLHHGELRLVDVNGGPPWPCPVPLTWRPAEVREPLVLHVGKLWDGTAEQLRDDVDIVAHGDRIVDVAPHRPGRASMDATELTAMPGLVDMHVHAHMKDRFYGSRQGRVWLSFGVTTIRSPGDPAYHAVQDKEAGAAGLVVGPRYFGMGEGIDGRRIHYSNMRATLNSEELARELERVAALDYDVVKLYVRLPWDLQQAAIEVANRDGRWVTGHYLYPAVLFGADGKEHIMGTNRLGYAQTQTRLGQSYSDVTTLICETGVRITPTLQKAILLIADDEALATDPRVTALYPSWEYAALQKRISLVMDDPEYHEELTKALVANADTAVRLHNGGAPLVAGTDAPLDLPGIGLHMNLRALVARGLSPYQSLRTSTHHAAVALGLADTLGVIEPGAHADIALVVGDPLRDINAAAAVRKVVSRGALFDVDELISPYQKAS
ncbi:MAG TPA: amidohydrolase family protein, partial [Micromonosporaceae bacterium]